MPNTSSGNPPRGDHHLPTRPVQSVIFRQSSQLRGRGSQGPRSSCLCTNSHDFRHGNVAVQMLV